MFFPIDLHILNGFSIDQISWIAYLVFKKLGVANDRSKGYLKTVIAIHNSSIAIMLTSNIYFPCQPCHRYGLLVNFISLCLLLYHRAHFSLSLVITCFTSSRFGSIINILVFLDVFFFSCFLLAQVVVASPNVLPLP
jgi:hypothetical protein